VTGCADEALLPPLQLCALTVRQASLPELIDVAGDAGYASITTSPVHVAASKTSLSSLRRRCDEAGVTIGYLDGLSTPLPGITEGVSEDVFFEQAEMLGTRLVNVVHYGGDPMVEHAEMVDALGALADRAARRALSLVVEFIPGTAIPDLPVAIELVRAVDRANLRILLDTWHLGRSGGGPDLLVDDVPALVGAVQVSDRTREQDRQPYVPMSGRYLPGEGELPLAAMLRPVLAAHPRMPVGVEVINDELRAMTPREAATVAHRTLRGLLEGFVGERRLDRA
jgi:sugar phosphate isomerase/epimerase